MFESSWLCMDNKRWEILPEDWTLNMANLEILRNCKLLPLLWYSSQYSLSNTLYSNEIEIEEDPHIEINFLHFWHQKKHDWSLEKPVSKVNHWLF